MALSAISCRVRSFLLSRRPTPIRHILQLQKDFCDCTFERNSFRKETRLLARLAHFVARHRLAVIGIWVVLTHFGGFAAGRVSKRWYQSFPTPRTSPSEATQP